MHWLSQEELYIVTGQKLAEKQWEKLFHRSDNIWLT